MTKFVTQKNSFKSGILGKKLFGRTDIAEHTEAMSDATNAYIAKQGGAYKRAGSSIIFKYTETVIDVQLESVTLFSDQTIYISFEHHLGGVIAYNLLDVYGNRIPFKTLDPPVNSQINIIGELTALDLIDRQFKVTVYESFIIVTHTSGLMAPIYIELSLSDSATAQIDSINNMQSFAFSWSARPLSDVNNDPSKTIVITAPANSPPAALNFNVVLTATGFEFEKEKINVGDYVQITGTPYTENGIHSQTNIYEILTIPTATTATAKGFQYAKAGGRYDPMFNLNQLGGGFGMVNFNGSAAFDEWSVTQWSTTKGWPKICSVDEGRLIMANTSTYPTSMWASKLGAPRFFIDKRFSAGLHSFEQNNISYTTRHGVPYEGDIVVTDPYNFVLPSTKGAEITFMQSSITFVVGTSRQEFVVSGEGTAISQKNITIRPHTSHGSALNSSSLIYDNTVVYASRDRRSIFLFKWNDMNGSFVSKEATILNDELFTDDRIRSMDWHEELGVLFINTEFNNIYTFALNNETATAGFTKVEMDADILDLAYGIDGQDEFMMAAIKINNKFYLARLGELAVFPSIGKAFPDIHTDRAYYLDNFQVSESARSRALSGSITEFPRINYINPDDNFIWMNTADLQDGDLVRFLSDNLNVFSDKGLNISINTIYEVTLFDFGSEIGVSLSIPAGAPIVITQVSGEHYFPDSRVYVEKVVSSSHIIPIRHFPAGKEITVLANLLPSTPFPQDPNDGTFREMTFITDGSDTYDLTTNPQSKEFTYDMVVYGQKYEFHISTVPIEAGQQFGSSQLGLKRVDKAGVRYYNTRSFEIGTNEDQLEHVNTRDKDGLKTIGRKEIALQANSEFDQVVHIKNRRVEPCYISSLTLKGVSNDG